MIILLLSCLSLLLLLLFDPFSFHLFLVDVESVFTFIHVAMLIKNEGYAGRIAAIGIPQSRCGVKFVFGAFKENRAVSQSDGHTTYVGILEILLVIAHLDRYSRLGCCWWGRMAE